LESQLIYYFYVLVTILVLFFLDAIREMRKYSDDPQDSSHSHHDGHLDVQMQTHMRLFRAQRNFYISGFALFLCLVIRRMVTLLSNNACLDVEKEAAMKQAQSASRAAEELMKGGDGAGELKEKLAQRELELNKALKDVASMKTQAENLSSEYDRLCDEKNALERKLAIQGDGDKKDD